MAAIWLPILGLVLCVTGSLGCDDLDSAACVRLSSTRPNMCNETCFASVCKRYCGKCPLKCYTCTDIANPQMCNVSTECPSTDHRCISVKSYTNDFRLVYKLGCAPSGVCSGTNCCSQDLCNNHSNKKRKMTKRDSIKAQKDNNGLAARRRRQTLSAACADVDNLACTLLFTSNTNICQDSCVANVICPRLCGKCTECYDCDHVLTTERCNHSRICQAGEVCFTLETLNFDLEHGYRMGCVHQRICDSISTQVGNVFGRRSNSIEVSMTGGCCHGDLCNHHKLTPVAMSTSPPITTLQTIPTTTAKTCTMTGGCPFIPSARYNGQCYFLGNYQMTWLNAKAFCEAHCSHLAVFHDLNDLRHVLDFLKHDNYLSHLPIVDRHGLPDLYVDAVNPAHASQFMWSTTLEFIPDSMFDNPGNNHLFNCAIVHNRRQLQGVSCLTTFYPLCQRGLRASGNMNISLSAVYGDVSTRVNYILDGTENQMHSTYRPFRSSQSSGYTWIIHHDIDSYLQVREYLITSNTADMWRVITGLVLLAVTCYACDDMDTSVCHRLATAKPDMCNDTCFASICQRFCGQCPLKCYSCSDIESSQLCNSTVECNSKDYQCISAASFTNDFREVFKLGCAPSSVCSHYGKRSIDKRAGTSCCTSDLCNHGSGSKRAPDVMSLETGGAKRQVASPVCDDTDSLACTLLFTVNTHMCSDDCIANKICPRLCGKCTKCYECDHVTSTENCTESRVCDPGEVCFTVETLNFNLEHGFKLGCVNQKICDSLHAQASTIFGRRASGNIELSLSGGCCHGELCNHHQLLPESITSPPVTTTHPTTTRAAATTHRACHYYPNKCTFSDAYVHNGECYHIEPSPMTWIQAKHFCESRCGHLASFSDLSEMSHTLSGVAHYAHSSSHAELYVDAIDPGHNNRWVWESNLTPVASNFFHSISSHQLSYCAATTATLQKLVAVDCSSRYLPLCQHTRHP